ncbi:MAG: XdhC family protein [Acidobacteria bacterium]|nr:XdhC family protein [Acidobacteriota bacterium]
MAKAVIASGVPSLRHYNTGEEDVVWGLGLGCNGLVDIFVQPATEGPLAALAGRLEELLAGESALALATVVAPGEGGEHAAVGASLAIEPAGVVHGSLGAPELDGQVAQRAGGLIAAGRSGVQAIAGRKVFFDVLPPPRHLVVCGAGDDARPLVAYAADVGFRVTLLDHRPALLAPEWFPQAARRVVARPEDPDLELPRAERALAVVKTHSLAHDREWVRRLLAAGFPYVGVLGPRGRTEAILREIEGAGAGDRGRFAAHRDRTADRQDRVFGPVGLDLGADGPRQVAISIVAELLAFTAQREPRHLSARQEAIHAV